MIHETFVAANPETAYKLAVEKYGTGIVLISAKQIQDNNTLRSEITISVEEERFKSKSFATLSPEHNESDEKILLSEIGVLKSQIETMKMELHQEIQEENPVLTKVKALFVKKGISSVWLEGIFRTLLGSDILNDASLLAAYLLEEIDLMLKIKEEDFTQAKIMMIVGPTGVGKTTTIAKLAARYTYFLDKSYKVALINLDYFKIGAIEQLSQYANIMQIEHYVADDVDSFQEILSHLQEYDIILVDTTGMSPYDTEKFIQTIEFVKADISQTLDVNLLLSATVKYEDMEDIYQNFSFLNLDSLIISKFDETKHFGTLLNFMLMYQLPLSYFTMGQEVPDDLIVANKEYLLENFIGDIHEG